MLNLEIAAAFTELADLLELKGENPFKVRAYRRAATTLQALGIPVSELVTAGRLHDIEGIGAALGAKVVEYLATGSIVALEKLRVEVPPSLLEVTAIPGIGPRLAMRLYRELGVVDRASLQRAIDSHQLRTLKGLGPKSEANIIAGLRQLSRVWGCRPLFEALPLAHELASGIRRAPGVQRAEIAGSIRRRREMVGDIDLVVATEQPEPVSDYLHSLLLVKRVLASGDTRISIVLQGGVQVDIRMVRPTAFTSAWHHFTGSKEHHVALRHLALSLGYSVSEYGLLHVATDERLEPETEEELYGVLGLPYIAPELREGVGEIAAALGDRLPLLVNTTDIRGDLHVHSHYSDGVASLAAISLAAKSRGLEYVAICDHSSSLVVAGGMTAAKLAERNREIAWVNEHKDGAVLLTGVEVDILADGSLDYPDEVLAQQDVVVASIHTGFRQDKSQIMHRLQSAMQNLYVHIIGHPSGRLLGRRSGYAVDYDELISGAYATGTALEINASPNRLDLPDVQARKAATQGVMVAVNTDAHDVSELDFLDYGLGNARRAWLTSANVINCLTITDLREWLTRKRLVGGR